jgi:O-antigen/teichoic acid export membrane protein
MKDDTPTETQASATNAADLLRRIARVGKYSFWTGAGFVLSLGVDRLLVCPLLNRSLGGDVFGGFLWVLGLMNLFGNVAANGFALYLLRQLAGQPRESARRMMNTAILLSIGLSIAVLVPATAVSLPFADPALRAHAWAVYFPLGVFALGRSLELLFNVILRIERRFATMFVVRVIEAVVLLANLWIAPTRNLWAIGTVYAASIFLAFPLFVHYTRSFVGGPIRWDSVLARALLCAWVPGALMTFMEQTQVYASRLVLGVVGGAEDVAVLYAGTSIGNIFVAPIGLVSTVVLSLLASSRLFALSGRLGKEYLAVSGALAAAVGLVSWLAGRWLIAKLYPDLSASTLEFYGWIAVGNAFMSFALLLRPIAVRYLPLKRVAAVSAVTVTVQLAALAALVPSGKAQGAAMSLAGSSLVACILWLVCFTRAGHASDDDRSEPITEEGTIDS